MSGGAAEPGRGSPGPSPGRVKADERPELRRGTAARLFVALLLTEEMRATLSAEVDRLRPLSRAVAWVPGPNLHITLRFLGDQPADGLEAAEGALRDAAATTAPFALALGGIGAFPALSRPRILWVGVTAGAADARALQTRLEEGLASRGLGRDERPWHPHLTIGRVLDERRWRREADTRLGPALQSAAGRPFGTLPIRAVSLMRSELSPRGARYQELRSVALAGVRAEAGR